MKRELKEVLTDFFTKTLPEIQARLDELESKVASGVDVQASVEIDEETGKAVVKKKTTKEKA